jgi:large subunit ribosomal protein L23
MITGSVIISPLITEKGTAIGEKSNQVVFRVRKGAGKNAIRATVEEMFKVTVVKVRTSNFLGKKRRRGRVEGRQSDWKKAYVTLKTGDRIEFFEGV